MPETKKYLDKEKCFDLFYVISILTIVFFIIWSFTGMWPWTSNPYNSFSLQASSWLKGRLDLGQNYEYLELAIVNQKYYVSFPPFPSFVLLPFAVFMGSETPDGYIAFACVLIAAVYSLKLTWSFGKSGFTAVFWTLFLTVGSNLVYVTVNGWVWFLAQNLCFALSIMAIYYAVKGKGGWSLFFWACSVGCRPFQIIYFPLLIWILYKKYRSNNSDENLMIYLKKHWYWAVAPILIAGSFMALNYARFGSISEFGHNYLPEFQRAEKGQFNVEYLLSNIKKIFLLPTLGDNNKIEIPRFDGMALWIASPIFISYFIYIINGLINSRKKKNNLVSMHLFFFILLCVHTALILSHRTVGGIHYGNRYFVDLLPYLYFEIFSLMPENDRLQKFQYPLLFFGIASNLMGTVIVYNNWV